ncbi:hypothetical protein ACH5RR_032061 [Cinchona calisaya]|uniref:Uncharacterized protein n=1 Tax=Cinchona calisaya TaxID=153742 RepID=A0ABD2YL32_9GENT
MVVRAKGWVKKICDGEKMRGNGWSLGMVDRCGRSVPEKETGEWGRCGGGGTKKSGEDEAIGLRDGMTVGMEAEAKRLRDGDGDGDGGGKEDRWVGRRADRVDEENKVEEEWQRE